MLPFFQITIIYNITISAVASLILSYLSIDICRQLIDDVFVCYESVSNGLGYFSIMFKLTWRNNSCLKLNRILAKIFRYPSSNYEKS